jgi:hypothetical protein
MRAQSLNTCKRGWWEKSHPIVMRAWGLSTINLGECESTLMGKREIRVAIVGSFCMQFLEQQGSGEHWSLKETIVGVVGSLLELLLHEEVGC